MPTSSHGRPQVAPTTRQLMHCRFLTGVCYAVVTTLPLGVENISIIVSQLHRREIQKVKMTAQSFSLGGGFERGTARSKVPLHLLLLHTFLSNKEKYAVGDMTSLLFIPRQKRATTGRPYKHALSALQTANTGHRGIVPYKSTPEDTSGDRSRRYFNYLQTLFFCIIHGMHCSAKLAVEHGNQNGGIVHHVHIAL